VTGLLGVLSDCLPNIERLLASSPFYFPLLCRIVSIEPSDLVGIVGEHEDFPVERMRLSHDSKYLASSSHDNSIKFWNIQYLYDEDAEGEEEEGEGKSESAKMESKGESDGEDEDEDEDEDEEMEVDEAPAAKNKGKGRTLDDDEENGDGGQDARKKQKRAKAKGKGKARKGFYNDL